MKYEYELFNLWKELQQLKKDVEGKREPGYGQFDRSTYCALTWRAHQLERDFMHLGNTSDANEAQRLHDVALAKYNALDTLENHLKTYAGQECSFVSEPDTDGYITTVEQYWHESRNEPYWVWFVTDDHIRFQQFKIKDITDGLILHPQRAVWTKVDHIEPVNRRFLTVLDEKGSSC